MNAVSMPRSFFGMFLSIKARGPKSRTIVLNCSESRADAEQLRTIVLQCLRLSEPEWLQSDASWAREHGAVPI